MSSLVLLLSKLLALLILVAAALMIWHRRDAWGRLLLISFLAIAHGRRLVWNAVRL